MNGIEQAERFLLMANKDYQALSGMTDSDVFSVEIFGFHAQQVVEKALKAWLCVLEIPFPRIHDLDELAALLSQGGVDASEEFESLLAFTDFAVTFRYDAFPEFDTAIDRREVIECTGNLLRHVGSLVKG